MRRKSRLYHTLGACLLCLLCSLNSLAQREKSPEASRSNDAETNENGSQAAISAIRTPFDLSPNRAESFRSPAIFAYLSISKPAPDSGLRFAPAEDFSVVRQSFLTARRRGGILALLSSAAGITQTGDFRFFDSRLPVSSNGQRPTSNNFTIDGFSANLGITPEETSLAGNAG